VIVRNYVAQFKGLAFKSNSYLHKLRCICGLMACKLGQPGLIVGKKATPLSKGRFTPANA
jgi:hypothetical protein